MITIAFLLESRLVILGSGGRRYTLLLVAGIIISFLRVLFHLD